jgi:hypothetical protein
VRARSFAPDDAAERLAQIVLALVPGMTENLEAKPRENAA